MSIIKSKFGFFSVVVLLFCFVTVLVNIDTHIDRLSLHLLVLFIVSIPNIIYTLTKVTAAQNEEAFSCYRVRGLHFLAVVFWRLC